MNKSKLIQVAGVIVIAQIMLWAAMAQSNMNCMIIAMVIYIVALTPLYIFNPSPKRGWWLAGSMLTWIVALAWIIRLYRKI